ncbi:MAG: leucyl aminopeptidase family protein [Pseudomonadota bacterium]|nr:MAG: leucyl aminopeptidase family protein [Pseudomonadota bacterium]
MLAKTPKITSKAGALSKQLLDKHENVILLLPKKGVDVKSLPNGAELARRMGREDYKLGAKTFVADLAGPAGTRLALAGIESDISTFELLTLARRLVAAHADQRPKAIVIVCHRLESRLAARAAEAVLAAALAADFELPTFKSKPNKRHPLAEITLYGVGKSLDTARTIAEAQGNNLARYLTALPPNELTPGQYRRRVEKLARQQGWQVEFIGIDKLRRLGAGAFLAVAQGSPEPDAGILHLRYAPRRKTAKKSLALVGKGICFDTGGTNLKPARYMHGMHEDMEGSAVALGTLLALTALKANFAVDCWLALAQNHIGPKAYKQNDVVRAANGKTIEVVHTDAEGRMVLADTLYLASKQKPIVIVDYATLTGACVAALSTRMSGAFTNRAAWVANIIKAGEESGERVWPFPIPDDFTKALKSNVADIKQCTLDSDADHILAALFLKQFLEGDPAWVHVDLAAGNHKGGLAHIPSDVTGFGVRFTLDLLLNQKLLS